MARGVSVHARGMLRYGQRQHPRTRWTHPHGRRGLFNYRVVAPRPKQAPPRFYVSGTRITKVCTVGLYNLTPCIYGTRIHPRYVIVQELCESRGGRPGLSVLTSLLVSVDVKLY